MKRLLCALFLWVFVTGAFAGRPSAPVALEAGRIYDTVVCQADATQSYALYIPRAGNNAPLPVVYFFDAHGDGSLPVTKYKALADTYGFILAGSNNSKNGNDWATADAVWRTLFTDTQKRLKINSGRVYTCGFSGGAKVASYMALEYPVVKGVIANGAGLPDGMAVGDFSFSFTAVAGEGDMNMTDLVALNAALANTRTRHRILLFNGKHEWAPESTMNIAFSGLQLDAMRSGLAPKNEAFINGVAVQSKKRLETFYQQNQMSNAALECTLALGLLDGLTSEAAWFKQQAATIAGNKLYQQQMKQEEALLAKEQNIKAGYIEHFRQEDNQYWTSTISNLQKAATAKTAESPMYQRLLAYLSLAFYSISNQTINSNQNDAARHFVNLYKLADPTNSEAWYFSAVLHARQKQAQLTENDLLKAAACGFTDKARLHRQPEFKSVLAPAGFTAVEKKMGAH